MRYLFIQLFLGLFLLPLQAQTDDRIYEKVDQDPIFGNCSKKDAKETKACSDQALMLFMTRNLVYPAFAIENNIQGTVYVSFVVRKDGTTSDHKLVKDIGGGCGKEALRVTQMMNSWKPGMQDGQPVNTVLTIPFKYRLTEDTEGKVAAYTLYTGTFSDDQIRKDDLQKALSVPPTVRDAAGNALKIQQLTLTIEGKRKLKSITTTDTTPNSAMRKLAKKTKKGGMAMLSAKATKDGKPVSVERTWTVSN
jgi:Gram-negative bacterial TonB protein C-terminal